MKRYYDSNSHTQPVTLLAVNGNGEILWEHTYEEMKESGNDVGFTPFPAADGYILTGDESGPIFDQNSDSGWRNSWGMMGRLDDQGNFLWKRHIEQYPYAAMTHYLEANDGGMFGAGMNYDDGRADGDYFVAKSDFVVRFDADGNVLWCNSYPRLLLTDPEQSILNISALLPAPDDGVIVVAQNWKVDRLKLIHLDSDGTILADWWQEIDFPIDYVKAFTVAGQNYLVYHERPSNAPGINTYIAPIISPES